MEKLFCRCRLGLEEEKRQCVHYSLVRYSEEITNFRCSFIENRDAWRNGPGIAGSRSVLQLCNLKQPDSLQIPSQHPGGKLQSPLKELTPHP